MVRDDEDMDVVLAAMVVLASAIAAVVVRRQTRDQRYRGLADGERPAPGAPATTEFVDRHPADELTRPVPPDVLSPGLTGVVLDGRANPIEVAATLIDLAEHGRVVITERPAPADSPLSADWQFTRVYGHEPAPVESSTDSAEADAASPDPAVPASPEDALLQVLFADANDVLLSELTLDRRRGLNQVTDLLLVEAERRQWFRRLTHPADTSLRLAGPVVLLLGAVAIVMLNQPWLGGGLMLGGVVLWALTQGLPNPPVTADGYALRAQARQFGNWLSRTDPATQAEVSVADQVRYLPYAMVLGQLEAWRSGLAQTAGTAAPDGFSWLVPLAADRRLLTADGAIPRLVADLAQQLVAARAVSDVAVGANLIQDAAASPQKRGQSPSL